MNTPFIEQGLQFGCTRCSACCRHESGYVFLSKADIVRLHQHLNISEEEFLTRYCRVVPMATETRVSLIEQANHDCVFWHNDTNGCMVYDARPLQCQSYPFWPQILTPENWLAEGFSCPGIGQGKRYSYEEILAILARRDSEPLIALQSDDEDSHEN
jgi:Fe-S-cluster containining protein